jgi:hypothetical protein
MSDEIEIPASAWEVKAVFATRPGDEIVAEIKTYIKAFGTPYLWRGHTHAPPPKEARIVYLDEIGLPPTHCGELSRHRWSPCPCCSPRHPKFYKAGMIAWFPDEQTIRIIGPECFVSFNLDGHVIAYDAFRREQEERKTTAFLLSLLGHVGGVVSVIDHNAEAVKETDRVRDIIARRIPVLIEFDLWNHVRSDQRLRTERKLRKLVRDRDGEEREVVVRESNVYGPVIGHIMLRPKAKPIYDRLRLCLQRLRLADFGEAFAERLATLSLDDRKKLAKLLQVEVGKAHYLLAEATEVRSFLSPENVATLRGWGKHEDCPAKLHIALTPDGMLQLGKTKEEFRTLTIKPSFRNSLRQIPILSPQRSAAE